MKRCKTFLMGWAVSLLCLTPAHATTVAIPYTGLKKAHVSYDSFVGNSGIPSDASKYVQVRLEVASGSTQTLAESAIPPDSSISFSGTKLVENLDAGEATFRIVRKREDGLEETLAEQTVTIHDNAIDGTLLFDETIEADGSSAISVGSVIVPEGITLDLGTLSYVGQTIRVSGSIALDEAILDTGLPVRIIFTKPVSLSGPPNAYYVLNGAGSSIGGGSDLTVAAADATLSDIDHLTLAMEYSTATVHVLHSTVTFNIWDLLATSQVWFDDCVFANEGVYIRTGDDFQFNHCVFPHGPTVNIYRPGGKAKFEECFFRGTSRIEGKVDSECVFQNCEFADVVWLDERTGPVFRNNQFLGYIYFAGQSWVTDQTPSPVIEQNSFMGRNAFLTQIYSQVPSARIAIGQNYYGDRDGPKRSYWDVTSQNVFLKERGALVFPGFKGQDRGPLLEVAPAMEKGPGPRKDTTTPPTIWVNNVIMGQNTLSHTETFSPLVAGRDSLLCADIACSETNLSGAEIYLEINDQRFESTDPSAVLHRDIADYGGDSDLIRAQSTVNFIIPPLQAPIESLRLMADVSGVKGLGQEKSPQSLWEIGSYPLLPAPGRKLNVVVQPVKLYLYGFTGTPAPPATALIQDLSDLMPAMFPISDREINFVSSPPITYTGVISNFAWIGSYSLITGLASLLGSARTFMNVASWAGNRPDTKIDFVVGLVPKDGLGQGIDGANTAVDRGILMVDASKPTAAIHEMGHGIGLYTSQEQYDQVPPDGMEVRSATLFKTEDGYVPGFSGDQNRIRHMPSRTLSWYANQGWIDVMGAQDVPIWPTPSTLSAFRSNFQGRLQVSKETVKEKGELPIGMRTLFVRAMVEKIGDGTEEVYYRFVPGTLHAAPIDRGNQDSFDVADSPQQIKGQYEFRGYADDGNRWDFQAFQLVPNAGPTEERYDLWWATFVIANSIVNRYEIVSVETDEKVLEYLPGGTVENNLESPTSGSTLDESEVVSWDANSTPSPLKRTGPAPPLTHHLLASQDGGTTWLGVDVLIDGATLELVTDFLPAGDNISLRLLSTDGLQTAESRVDHLRIENRPPTVRIFAPLEGDRSEVGYAWTLYGSGYDLDDQVLVRGWWTSSVDGFLGSGNTLEGVVLSPGSHELVFHATDTLQAEGTASVQVLVAAGSQFDFALAEESLRLRGPDSNPQSPALGSLVIGAPHASDLSIRNDGSKTTLSLQLFLQEPSSVEVLLASREFDLEPFETAILPATFEVGSSGDWFFRGELRISGDRDPEPGNNTRTWIYPAIAPQVTPSPSPSPSPTPDEGAYDLDGDFILTDLDLFVFSYHWGRSVPPGESLLGDYDENLECDARDLMRLIGAFR